MPPHPPRAHGFPQRVAAAHPPQAPASPSFLGRVLEVPSYGWTTPDGALSKPTPIQLVREALSRMNVLRSRKAWLPFTNWFWTLSLTPFLVAFALQHFSIALVAAGFVYSMVGMGSFGTLWLHRYATHGAYTFKSRLARFVTANLVIRVVPEEIYVISHHVHHAKADEPGDPYNAAAGGLYCFLADTNHQPIAKDLSRDDYARVCKLMEPTGIRGNTYEQYLTWGSYAHPVRTSLSFALNWAFWYAAFFLVGGHALATALFGSALFWAIGIRTFNFTAHGSGEDRRRDGVDFSRRDTSINQLWPGFVAGEWHNNHHLFCSSARNGFLWYQLDAPYLYIRALAALGGISSYRDHTSIFFEKHYLPYLARTQPEKAAALMARLRRRPIDGPVAPEEALPEDGGFQETEPARVSDAITAPLS